MVTGDVATLGAGYKFTEGPVWMKDGTLLFSDIPADTIFKGNGEVFRKPSGMSNGLTLDREGRLIAAEHQTRRVTRTEKDGTITVLAERFEGKRLNSPNDVIVRSDGVLFFTDPPYGLPGGPDGPNAELKWFGLFAILPDGALKMLKKDFLRPNGLTLSPDEKLLYVADTSKGHIRAFDLAKDGTLSGDRVFCELPGPDGIKCDVEGNVWATASDGVRVVSPQGELLETVVFPEGPANCGFGGQDGKTLYVTARSSVYTVTTAVAGIHPAR
ncbi:MAG: SMP-30/gluconolactonase/LRE family protein [Candidatus Hydrogenedentes bacterium]|nr:SMP-30/gluconolactonase/LRE family protein [Candidatus Hydrogenedentota bacterium]